MGKYLIIIMLLFFGCSSDLEISSEKVQTTQQASQTCISVQRTGSSGVVYDANIRAAFPNNNYGSNSASSLGTFSSQLQELIIKFDLSSVPTNATVNSATATFNNNGAPCCNNLPSSTISAYNVTSSWAENTVTWNSISSSIATSSFASVTDPGYQSSHTFTLDLCNGNCATSPVSTWVSNSSNNNGMTLSAGSGQANVYTSEFGTVSQRPILNLCYTVSSSLCSDGIKDGNETDIDCGGGPYMGNSACATCANGKTCLVSGDCTSSWCYGSPLICQANSCSDNVKDGTETDVDCGGNTCSGCADGKVCSANADCASNLCSSGVCVSCVDGIKNGSETDVDCGGSFCDGQSKTCANGKICIINTDCTSGLCYNGLCYAQGTSGTVTSSCTLPSVPTGFIESTFYYKSSDIAHGWAYLTLPPSETTIIGAVVLIHPGAWGDGSTGAGTGSDPWPGNQYIVLTREKLSGLGYVVVTPAHRSDTSYVHPAEISDIRCATYWTVNYMSTNSLSSRLFMAGSSSGAELAVLNSLTMNNTSLGFDDGTCPLSYPGTISSNGGIGWSGVYDPTQSDLSSAAISAITTYLGYSPSSNSSAALAAFPISYPNPLGLPPIMLSHGTADPALPSSESQNMFNKLIALGENSTLVLLSGSTVHAGELFDSNLPAQGCTALNFLANN